MRKSAKAGLRRRLGRLGRGHALLGSLRSVCRHCRRRQEASVERHRTAGMTAIAVLDIIFGVVGILVGLFNLLGAFVLFYELLRVGVFEIPMARLTFSLLLLATGIVGLIAGLRTLALRP